MSRVRSQVISVGTVGDTSMRMLELRREDTGATVFQTTIADVQEGQWLFVDPSTTRVYTETGEDLTYLPQSVTVRGRITRT